MDCQAPYTLTPEILSFRAANGCPQAECLAAAKASMCDFTVEQCAQRNYFMFPEYACATSFFGGDPVFGQWVGFVIVLAFGIVFGLFTVFLVWIDHFVLGTENTSEWFNTAGRTIKTGLTASVIVSQWTWAATLLQSSNVAWKYGISGPFWYASGATIQILLFAILAILVKRRAPTAHTFLEIIRARWGTPAHLVFTFFAFLTNIIVTSMLILGGSAVVNALTGVNVDLASFLIPLGVIAYTMAGGLKATFVASYFNTAVILLALVIFSFQVYAGSNQLGSPGEVWRKLGQAAAIEPVKKNHGGSYLTILSLNGFFFGMTNIVGNFGTVFLDQSYWQSAIAATPSASWKGYLLGGLCWFSIPFTLATSLGLAGNALSLPITASEAGAGLVPPAVAKYLMGNGGAFLILLMLFMAVTSTGAAEQIAVSSLVAYDIYRTYIKPDCDGRGIIFVSRIAICVFGLLMGVLGIILNKIGVSLGWLYLAMGNMIGSGVIPVAMAISWRKCSGVAAIAGAVSGLIAAMCVWLIYSKVDSGEVTLASTGEDAHMLAGNLTAILFSGFVCTVISLIKPDDADWETTTKMIPLVEEDAHAHLSQDTEEEMKRAMKFILSWGIGLTLLLVVAWPVLTIPAGVFPEGYFTFWVAVSITWGILACLAMIFLPLWESRGAILGVLTNGKVLKWDAAKRAEEQARAKEAAIASNAEEGEMVEDE